MSILRNRTISKGELNSLLIFGLMPFFIYFSATVVAYIVFFTYLAYSFRLRNKILVLAVASFTSIYVVAGPFAHGGMTKELLNSINTSVGFFLVLVSPWIRMRIRLKESLIVDFFIFIFVIMSLFLGIPGVKSHTVLQIGSFNIALYFAISYVLVRKLLLVSAVGIAGGRSIILGGVYGLLMWRFQKFHKWLSLSVLILIAVFVLSGTLFVYLQDYLLQLQELGIYLKGRTRFWLSLLEVSATFFGNGSGASLETASAVKEIYQLPHNDYLRIYVDYGVILLLVFAYSLWKNSLRGPHHLFATAMLAAYLVTGNPLSFSTVIVSYLLVINIYVKDEEV